MREAKGSFLSLAALAALVVALAPAAALAAGAAASGAATPDIGWDGLRPPTEAKAHRFTPGAVVDSVSGSPATTAEDKPIPLHIRMVTDKGVSAAAKPSRDFDLAAIKNKHIKTTLQYTMGGKAVWVSGGFDREQKAFVSVLEDGKAARFFNVEEIFGKPPVLDIGTAKYKLSLSPDMSDQLESEIVLTNVANRKDRTPITLREMLTAVTAAGESATIGGKAYKFFYYDDIKNGGLDPATQSLAFVYTDPNGELHVFLVPAELISTDQITIFKMYDNAPVGLQKVSGTLKVFEQP